MTDLSALPGGEVVEEGLVDLREGRETVAALLVTIVAMRLRRLGLHVPRQTWEPAELRLYRLLCDDDPAGAYSRYNSLLRRIDSFARALEHEHGVARRRAGGADTSG